MRLSCFITLLFLNGGVVSVHAAEGGYSNYIPGTYGDFAAAVEPPTELTVRNDIYRYEADSKASIRSGLAEAEAEVVFTMDLFTVLYKPGVEVLGGSYAFGALLPIVHNDIEANVQLGPFEFGIQDDTVDMGDITLIPGVIFWNRGDFHFSLAEYIVVPTSNYNSDNLANPGLNYWTFDTNVAVTYLNEQSGQDYSINVGYSYNSKNDDTDYRSGQEIHIDYMINQFLSESWAVGVHGFYLKQVTGDSGQGARLGGFKGQASGIGPAILWVKQAYGQEISFIAKWLHEYDSQRRLEGDHVMVSIALSF